ncbi:MAG: serine kinase [Clostridia bacterium]|nr:serine kinase [Clostridia bacterium]
MTLTELIDALSLHVVCPPSSPEREVRNVYVGDLLSRAMSRLQADDLWITIMTNTNVVAVAELTDVAAVLLAEDVALLPDAVHAAQDNGIAVLSSEKSAFELCRDMAHILKANA